MSESSYEVRRVEAKPYGRYVIALTPGVEAEMTFRRTTDGTMVINHTFVPQPFEGRGIAARLVEAAVADARAEGFRITPVCTYVAAQFRRHPQWQDLLD
ncbi:N-acetyltransferase [Azorhizobium oxalatiphilum]|uniref:N-acetyltransferase n=1 Tax=Azorhizobium oxalatiphilum TaxID=980631 RepID=A0A917C5X5_9HYPH|nr:GNAT family N-acetyltransferase [Azorhizobium oxalatiphilum]GGF71929.1 N-acetyltransferase [Azorhizobium oxalatiphilum]